MSHRSTVRMAKLSPEELLDLAHRDPLRRSTAISMLNEKCPEAEKAKTFERLLCHNLSPETNRQICRLVMKRKIVLDDVAPLLLALHRVETRAEQRAIAKALMVAGVPLEFRHRLCCISQSIRWRCPYTECFLQAALEGRLAEPKRPLPERQIPLHAQYMFS